jgi:hypothetical protein
MLPLVSDCPEEILRAPFPGGGAVPVADTDPATAIPDRPKTPQLILRSFTVRPTPATHVRFRVVTNQCTGNPLYAGEQDNDPRSSTDCATSTANAARQVVAAEFQVFSS